MNKPVCKLRLKKTDFLMETLSPMLLSCLGLVMQRLGRFGLMEDEGFARFVGRDGQGK